MKNIRNYIENKSKLIKEDLDLNMKLGKAEIIVLTDLSSNINLTKVLRIVSGTLPDEFLYGLDAIYITEHPDFEKRSINAFYADGALYISPDQDDNDDLINDIVHELGHHLEATMPEEIYADGIISDEFTSKRMILKRRLISAGLETGSFNYRNLKYDEEFDLFLLNELGYDTLSYITAGLFLSPYAATSLREYFAIGFEEFYLGDKEKLNNTSPTLYKKLEELREITD